MSLDTRFNEAAGIHRRKRMASYVSDATLNASMRPPEFTGGNLSPTAKW